MATLGELMTRRRTLTEEYDEANTELKRLKKERDETDALLLEVLEAQGVKKTSLDGIGTASATEKDVPTVVNWDAMYAYIIQSQQPHLLQRRLMNASILELIENDEKVPGVEISTVKTLSFRRN